MAAFFVNAVTNAVTAVAEDAIAAAEEKIAKRKFQVGFELLLMLKF